MYHWISFSQLSVLDFIREFIGKTLSENLLQTILSPTREFSPSSTSCCQIIHTKQLLICHILLDNDNENLHSDSYHPTRKHGGIEYFTAHMSIQSSIMSKTTQDNTFFLEDQSNVKLTHRINS